MNVPSLVPLVPLVPLLALLSLTAIACAPVQAAPPPVSSNVVATSAPLPPPPAPRPSAAHLYRLDFVLAVADGTSPATTTSFTMNLVEHDGGEVTIGKNVPLAPASGTAPSPRQDVGLKVKASLKNVGDDVYLEAQLELSSFDPPSTIRKIVERGDALAADGKPSLIASIDDDKKHYQLTVTPTKLR